MPTIQIRSAADPDLAPLLALETDYSTDYVWQMDWRDETGQPGGQLAISFRPVRLPRSMRVTFPRTAQMLSEAWSKRVCFLVAESEGTVQGYINLTPATIPGTAWVADFAVDRRFRRSGVGSALFAFAAHWARDNGFQRLLLEMQSKNYPGICFAQKHGLTFCGYNDRYYPNQDVALFFGMVLK